jgi:hypothetical protein
MGREIRYEPLSPEQFGENLSRFTGTDAGKAVSEMYAATDELPANGAIVDLEPVLNVLRVELTPVSRWIEKQTWN